MAKCTQAPPGVTRHRRCALMTRRGYCALGLRLIGMALSVWLVFGQVFLLHRSQGMGMYPAVRDGDLVMAYRLHKDYAKGDVVVYRLDGELHLGRIGAMATDVIMLEENGSLTVNGNPQNSGILYPTHPRDTLTYPLRVQEGMAFVLGDYRTQCRDSRDFGPIPLDNIQGKVIFLVRRRGL